MALQHCDVFVGRTMNWLYDHLRWVPAHTPVVIAKDLRNRAEFPCLEARVWPSKGWPARAWYRVRETPVTPRERQWFSTLTPVVMHSHFGYVAVAGRALRTHLGVPWVVSFYGADVYRTNAAPERGDRYGPLFEDATRVLALGPAMESALRRLGCPPEKLLIHALGVDLEGCPSGDRIREEESEPLQILFAGTYREKKGLPYLVEALVLLSRRGVPFHLHLVAGPGGREDDERAQREVHRRLHEADLEGRVTVIPFLPFADLMALALRCHVFVAPSVTAADGDAEGTPFVVQQMMLSSMPVVATRHSDIPYLFGDRADTLVPERDAIAIADRLQAYAERPELLLTDGTANRNRMMSAFDVRECAGELSAIYSGITG